MVTDDFVVQRFADTQPEQQISRPSSRDSRQREQLRLRIRLIRQQCRPRSTMDESARGAVAEAAEDLARRAGERRERMCEPVQMGQLQHTVPALDRLRRECAEVLDIDPRETPSPFKTAARNGSHLVRH
jgi:hypothetical protein